MKIYKIVIYCMLLVFFTTSVISAETPPEPDKAKASGKTIRGYVAWAAGVEDEDDIIGGLYKKHSNFLFNLARSKAMSFVSSFALGSAPVKAFLSIFKRSDGADIIQANFERVMAGVEKNREIIQQSSTKIISTVYQKQLSKVWSAIDTVSDRMSSSNYDFDKRNWKTMTTWRDRLDSLLVVSYDATEAVNLWQRANEVTTLSSAEQYKTFMSYINAAGVEMYTNLEYENVLEAKSVIGAEGGNIEKGLGTFNNNYETFFENKVRPAMGQIVRDRLTHVSTLDRGLTWKGASDKRFSGVTEDLKTHYSKNSAGYPNMICPPFPGRQHPFYNEINNYREGAVRVYGILVSRYIVDNKEYTYSVNGVPMKIIIIDVKNGPDNSGITTYIITNYSLHTYSKHTNQNSFKPQDFTYLRTVDGYYLYSAGPDMNYTIDHFVRAHKEIEYINYLQNGFEPALHIMESWYNKFVKEGSRSREDDYPMQAEKDLKRYYKDREWNITEPTTLISNTTLPSDVVIHPGNTLTILNGGTCGGMEYEALCRKVNIGMDHMIYRILSNSGRIYRAGDISVPLFHTITVKKGARIVLPTETYFSLRSKGQLIIEDGARVVRLDKDGWPHRTIKPSVLPGILNILL